MSIDELFNRKEITPGVFECTPKEHPPFDPDAHTKTHVGKGPESYDWEANTKSFAGGKQVDSFTGRPLDGSSKYTEPEI